VEEGAGLEDDRITTPEPGYDLLFSIQAEDDLTSREISKDKHDRPTFFCVPCVFVPAAPAIEYDAESGMEGGADCANRLNMSRPLDHLFSELHHLPVAVLVNRLDQIVGARGKRGQFLQQVQSIHKSSAPFDQ
jgi:hypothetical protein